jgi:enoyl-CoA hydratase/carnithine racemase/quinol monooxygenase YgiN
MEIAMSLVFETLRVREEDAVLFAEISAPPMNLLGPELVRDLVSLIQQAEADAAIKVLVFRSADPDYFISHVDVTRVAEYREAAAKLAGEPSLGLLFRRLSTSRLVTIAQIEGRVRGAGSELVMACDMRFAARESAIFGQFEPAFGVIPGAGGAQHLARLLGRGRALEVMLSAEDYDAELAERYGWINRALPARALGDFVARLARRIARFPAAGHVVVKDRVNAVGLPPMEDFRRDSDLFLEGVRKPEYQEQARTAFKRGFQTRDAEMELGRLLGDLAGEMKPQHTASSEAVSAGRAGGAKVALIVTIEVAPERRDQLLAALMAHRARCLRDEPGTLQIEVLAVQEDDTKVMTYEVYVDDAAFDVHRSGPSLARWRQETAGRIVKFSVIRCALVEQTASHPQS